MTDFELGTTCTLTGCSFEKFGYRVSQNKMITSTPLSSLTEQSAPTNKVIVIAIITNIAYFRDWLARLCIKRPHPARGTAKCTGTHKRRQETRRLSKYCSGVFSLYSDRYFPVCFSLLFFSHLSLLLCSFSLVLGCFSCYNGQSTCFCMHSFCILSSAWYCFLYIFL